MSTALMLSPADQGRPLSLEEFETAASLEGYHYELIDGRLYVSPMADLPNDWIEKQVFRKLQRYAERNPKVINHVTDKARVFVHAAPRTTCPEPDVAAYRNFPLADLPNVQWRDVSPILTVEAVSESDPKKDYERNRDLYQKVPSIQEYWLIDPREDALRPKMVVFRRQGRKWIEIHVPPGGTYATALLPGFKLKLDFRPRIR